MKCCQKDRWLLHLQDGLHSLSLCPLPIYFSMHLKPVSLKPVPLCCSVPLSMPHFTTCCLCSLISFHSSNQFPPLLTQHIPQWFSTLAAHCNYLGNFFKSPNPSAAALWGGCCSVSWSCHDNIACGAEATQVYFLTLAEAAGLRPAAPRKTSRVLLQRVSRP